MIWKEFGQIWKTTQDYLQSIERDTQNEKNDQAEISSMEQFFLDRKFGHTIREVSEEDNDSTGRNWEDENKKDADLSIDIEFNKVLQGFKADAFKF